MTTRSSSTNVPRLYLRTKKKRSQKKINKMNVSQKKKRKETQRNAITSNVETLYNKNTKFVRLHGSVVHSGNAKEFRATCGPCETRRKIKKNN